MIAVESACTCAHVISIYIYSCWLIAVIFIHYTIVFMFPHKD